MKTRFLTAAATALCLGMLSVPAQAARLALLVATPNTAPRGYPVMFDAHLVGPGDRCGAILHFGDGASTPVRVAVNSFRVPGETGKPIRRYMSHGTFTASVTGAPVEELEPCDVAAQPVEIEVKANFKKADGPTKPSLERIPKKKPSKDPRPERREAITPSQRESLRVR